MSYNPTSCPAQVHQHRCMRRNHTQRSATIGSIMQSAARATPLRARTCNTARTRRHDPYRRGPEKEVPLTSHTEARATFSGGKTDNRTGRIGALRRSQFRERGRLITRNHDRFQGEGSHEFCSPGASAGERRCVHEPSDGLTQRRAAHHAELAATWLTYAEAASYTGWSIGHLRNLASAGRIPVYGRPRVRRFRRDMLDLYLTDPNMAMRKFRAERNRPHDR